jgi:cyclic beta-1,2-glucan synthetase
VLTASLAGDAASRQSPSYPNGYGALTGAGDYATWVAGAHVPPAPWANVIANPAIGFCVTERGAGFAWAENSHFFRLTPWFNDPVSDPCGEVLYLRDVESGEVWTPTPAPAAAVGDVDSSAAYGVTHAPGVSRFSHERGTIATELSLAVPRADPVKIALLKITNRGQSPRRLSLTSYVEWALGAEREHTRHQLHTRYDSESGAIFARNVYAPDFTARVAFSSISETTTSHTARRDDFIGRNGDLTMPAALRNGELSGAVGAGFDPCAALRCAIELPPGETRTIVVLLGAATSDDDARTLIRSLA